MSRPLNRLAVSRVRKTGSSAGSREIPAMKQRPGMYPALLW